MSTKSYSIAHDRFVFFACMVADSRCNCFWMPVLTDEEIEEYVRKRGLSQGCAKLIIEHFEPAVGKINALLYTSRENPTEIGLQQAINSQLNRLVRFVFVSCCATVNISVELVKHTPGLSNCCDASKRMACYPGPEARG